jgi:hypothetical protein
MIAGVLTPAKEGAKSVCVLFATSRRWPNVRSIVFCLKAQSSIVTTLASFFSGMY